MAVIVDLNMASVIDQQERKPNIESKRRARGKDAPNSILYLCWKILYTLYISRYMDKITLNRSLSKQLIVLIGLQLHSACRQRYLTQF